MEEKTYRYQERIVVFMDLMGFKKLVDQEDRCQEIGVILDLPTMFMELYQYLKLKNVMISSISDSIVLSIRVNEKNAMNKILRMIACITGILLSQSQILLRGGIAVGKLYHDRQIVFGPALVKAYQLENNIAVYPRVVIDEEDLEKALKSCTQVSRDVNRKQFRKDKDGTMYFRCFRHTKALRAQECLLSLGRLRSRESDPRVLQKIGWMESELKECLENSQEPVDREFFMLDQKGD